MPGRPGDDTAAGRSRVPGEGAFMQRRLIPAAFGGFFAVTDRRHHEPSE
jgi:hypothetical protein